MRNHKWTKLDKRFTGKPLKTSGDIHHEATSAQRRKGILEEAQGKVTLRGLWRHHA